MLLSSAIMSTTFYYHTNIHLLTSFKLCQFSIVYNISSLYSPSESEKSDDRWVIRIVRRRKKSSAVSIFKSLRNSTINRFISGRFRGSSSHASGRTIRVNSGHRLLMVGRFFCITTFSTKYLVEIPAKASFSDNISHINIANEKTSHFVSYGFNCTTSGLMYGKLDKPPFVSIMSNMQDSAFSKITYR